MAPTQVGKKKKKKKNNVGYGAGMKYILAGGGRNVEHLERDSDGGRRGEDGETANRG